MDSDLSYPPTHQVSPHWSGRLTMTNEGRAFPSKIQTTSKDSSLCESQAGDQEDRGPDSGYVSRNTSKRTTGTLPFFNEGALVLDAKFFRRRKRMLKHYDKEIPPSTWNRFNDLQEQYSKSLLQYLSARREKSDGFLISVKLKVLGESEETARPAVLVLCDKDDAENAKKFFAQKHVKLDYQLGPSLEVFFWCRPPKLMAADDNLDIYGAWAGPDDVETLCGQLIRVCEPPKARVATLGGMIKVSTSDDEFMLYGLTAGHVFRGDFSDGDNSTDSGQEEEHEDEGLYLDDDDEVFIDEISLDEGNENSPDKELFDAGLDVELDEDPWPLNERSIPQGSMEHFAEPGVEWSKVGHIVLTSGHISESKGNLDWALVEIEDPSMYRSNHILDATLNYGQTTRKELKEFSFDPLPESNRPVLLLSGLGGMKEGLLSTHPSFIKLPHSSQFVKTFSLSLANGSKLIPGDCGSWVVDRISKQVYGHVVASDILEESYIVPLRSVFRQIREYSCANVVKLATESDIENWRARHNVELAPLNPGTHAECEVAASISGEKTFLGTSTGDCDTLTTVKPNVNRRGRRTCFSNLPSLKLSNQAQNEDSFSSRTTSSIGVPSPLVLPIASDFYRSKLYTPPSIAPFPFKDVQRATEISENQRINRVKSESALPLSSSASPSTPWRKLVPEAANKIKGAFSSQVREAHLQDSHSASDDAFSDRDADTSPETLLDFQYATIASWAEFHAPQYLKSTGWDSGYSTATSAISSSSTAINGPTTQVAELVRQGARYQRERANDFDNKSTP